MSAPLRFLVHMGGQAFYLLLEGFAWLLGRKAYRKETKAVRRAAHFYWKARALEKQGRLKEAFECANHAYSALRTADPKVTFLQMGYLVVSRLDDLGNKLGIPGAALKESEELLQVLRELQEESGKPSPPLDQIVAWLEYKVRSEPELPIE